MHARIILFSALLALWSTLSLARALDGVVTHVSDADTIWVRPAGARAALRLRLQGIDAPEICQSFGTQARDALAARVLRRQVRVSVRARDVYQRAVGRVSLEGQDLGAWLVAGGYAWSAGFQRHAGAYAQQQIAARDGRRGLWQAAAPLNPRTFRKRHGPCR